MPQVTTPYESSITTSCSNYYLGNYTVTSSASTSTTVTVEVDTVGSGALAWDATYFPDPRTGQGLGDCQGYLASQQQGLGGYNTPPSWIGYDSGRAQQNIQNAFDTNANAQQVHETGEYIIAAQQAARDKAIRLLAEFLDEEQRAMYDRGQHFDVRAPSGRVFRITKERVRGIFELNGNGAVVAIYCIHTNDWVPAEDNMLAQALMIKYNEAGFHAMANRTRLG